MLPDSIETGRLKLRVARPEDADALFALFNNWQVIKWLSAPEWPPTLERTRAFIEKCAVEGPDFEEHRVILLEGAPVGGIGWRNRPAGPNQSEAGPNIGFWLGEAHWGQGIMSEGAEGLVAALFAASPIPAIHSGVIAGNEASLRIQEKLGFEITGRGTIFSNPLQREMPLISTRVTRAGFATRKGGRSAPLRGGTGDPDTAIQT
ncbi:MAG: GNAT family N-acetyltransferase [Proteobacteria bacterium]|nr:GNAT family N-acetyltransferase [Pseudomonadota bacterium]